ncbi:MAG: hypothetical protein AOA65_2025 [Candidatus Bathyarchaeota archaeon BA1]|nr:MAG: hypothetical protein AOA65_2025 [Candidatus Bathyarchaeota archaeon BA1]
MGISYDKMAYELRYVKVYQAGARFWADPMPTEELVEFVREMNFPKGINVIEFGCGEGRDAIFLAKQGFNVTAIDVAPSAINRAREWAAQESVEVNFEAGDVVDLKHIPSSTYDLAVNVGCLQMIIDEEARSRHLAEALRVLKPCGLYFSCNIGGDNPVKLEELYEAKPKPGDLIPRKIKVNEEEKEITLPIIAAWPKSGEQYKEEFKAAGYNILRLYTRMARALGNCWIIIAQKPGAE